MKFIIALFIIYAILQLYAICGASGIIDKLSEQINKHFENLKKF